MTKINSMKFENGISCLLDVSKPIFAAGNLIGDIKIIEKRTYKEIQTIKEHNGTINSLFKLHDKSILSSSADRTMKKIRLTKDYLNYIVEFIFNGYDNYIFKGIELFNRKIISCSWDDKLYLWEIGNNKQYINTLKFNENQRVEDILEISKDKFSSVSDSEIKIWNSNDMSQLHSIKLQRGIITPNSLCKLNDGILISIFYHTIHIIDLDNFSLISSISMDQGNLSCITKLNDGTFLIAEDINTDSYCLFYLKQYLLEGDELQYISYKKDKFYKSNKNNDKEIRALIQFSDGVIAQGITGEFNGKDSGDIFFYE
jgi:WD40 repeat protein